MPNGISAQQVGDNQILCNEAGTHLDDSDDNSNTATPTDSCRQSSSEINQSQLSTTVFQNSMASDVSCRAQTFLSQSGNSVITQLEMLKLKLKVTQYKAFQLATIEAIQHGKDTIAVQSTGSGKFLCYIASILINPGKITQVIEPVVAVITNQIQNLKTKGIHPFALGRAAGKSKLSNF